MSVLQEACTSHVTHFNLPLSCSLKFYTRKQENEKNKGDKKSLEIVKSQLHKPEKKYLIIH